MRTTLSQLPLATLGALTLIGPSAAQGSEGPTPEASPPAQTNSAPAAPTAPAPSTATAPGASTQSTAPAPPATGGAHARPAPAVARVRQHAQATGTAAPAGSGVPAAHKPARARHPRSHKPARSQPRAGKPAPSPSALTPPLPLAFAALEGVPGFFIESFRVPPFLLPIYQAAGTAYGVPWQVLAAINEVETDYGRDLSVSSAGAEGWMQFLPSSWATYGVDANGDGFKDPYNPADAIFAAARYLRAAGAAGVLRGAIYAYNHSAGYVESVMLRAKLLGGTPPELVGAITGLTEGRFPVHARAHFSDGFPPAPAGSGAQTTPGTVIYSERGAPVIAAQDGRIVRIGHSRELGRFISLRDAYGNTYTYAELGSIASLYPVLRPHEPARRAHPTSSGEPREPRPTGPASAGVQPRPAAGAEATASGLGAAGGALSGLGGQAAHAQGAQAPAQVPQAQASQAQAPQAQVPPPSLPAPTASGAPAAEAPPAAPPPGAPQLRVFRAGPNDVYLHPLRRGVAVIAGTVLGRVGSGGPTPPPGEPLPHMLFQIHPAGAGAPLIDPKPVLDGWVALENTSVFHANGRSPFAGSSPSAGQVLLESKSQLELQVLANPGIDVYACGREDIQGGQIDRRVLAALEFLAVSGLRPTVSSLKCGRHEAAGEGNPLAGASGDAVEISAVNGIRVTGHDGPGSVTDTAIRKLLSLQGSMKPFQIVSPMSYPGTGTTLAVARHRDSIGVSFLPPAAQSARLSDSFGSPLTPAEWVTLIARLGEIPDPVVQSGPSAASIPDTPEPAHARQGAGNGNG